MNDSWTRSQNSAQEAIGGVLSIVATGLLTWIVFWMLARARDLSGHFRSSIDRSLVSSGLGILTAAGLGWMIYAGMLRIDLAFTVSIAIPPDSWYGTLLKGTLNFSPATTWLQLAVWLAYLLPTLTLFILKSRPGRPAAAGSTSSSTVTASDQVVAVGEDLKAQVETTNVNYAYYVRDQVAQLVTGTDAIAAAYLVGDVDGAAVLYTDLSDTEIKALAG